MHFNFEQHIELLTSDRCQLHINLNYSNPPRLATRIQPCLPLTLLSAASSAATTLFGLVASLANKTILEKRAQR